MFEKFLSNKMKPEQIFKITEKHAVYDIKILSKMNLKQIQQACIEQQKLIAKLTKKLQLGREEWEKVNDKKQELNQKNIIINQQIHRMTNEHQELNMKFDNLKQMLEMSTKENQSVVIEQVKYLADQGINVDKNVKNLDGIIKIYRKQTDLCKKIQNQNKLLKQKYAQLQEKFCGIQENLNQNHILQLQSNQLANTHQTQNLIVHNCKITIEAATSTQQSQILKINNQQAIKIQNLQNKLQSKQKQILAIRSQIIKYISQISQLKIKLNTYEQNTIQSLQKVGQKKYVEENSQQTSTPPSCPQNYFISEDQYNQKIKKLQQQIEYLKLVNKRILQQKAMIQQTSKDCLEQLQIKYQAKQRQCLKINQQIKKIQKQKQQIKNKFGIQNEQTNKNLQNLNKQLVNKDKSIKQLEKTIQNLKSQIKQLNHKIKNQQQEKQSKQRKYDSQINQQRIKVQNAKRNIKNLQQKLQQTKTSLQTVYQQSMGKNSKIATMEQKLKEYKYIIQVLRKQKFDMEKTFQSKLKGALEQKNLTANQQSVQDEPKQQEYHNQQVEGNQQDAKFNNQLMLRNRISNLEDRNSQLIKQLQNLQQKLGQIEQTNNINEVTIRTLNFKRQQMLKQLQKATKKAINNNSVKNQSSGNKQKDKKIAQKAARGFDIVIKLLNQLYKDFILHFTEIINTDERVKNMEISINQLISKTSDMKYIFHDYL